MKAIQKKKGFTLIELMAVIAIIAILAAVLVPTVSGYIDRSKKTALIAEIRSAVNAVETYNVTAIDKIPTTETVGELVAADSVLVKQELLLTSDLSKLNSGLTVDKMKVINSDEEALNSIFKKDNNFYYTINKTDEVIGATKSTK